MTIHPNYHFSITIYTEDLAIVNCLRALSQFSQKTGNNRIPCGNTKNNDWKRANHRVVFRFSKPEYREEFIYQIKRILPLSLLCVENQNDNDPAGPHK